MSHPTLLMDVLAPLMQLQAERLLLVDVERWLHRRANVCLGCDAPVSRCGPVLWSEGMKCCPDCTHEAPRA